MFSSKMHADLRVIKFTLIHSLNHNFSAEYSLLRHINGKHPDLWEKKYNFKKVEKTEKTD